MGAGRRGRCGHGSRSTIGRSRRSIALVAAEIAAVGLSAAAAAARHELELVNDDFELAALLTIALPLAPAKLALDGHLGALGQVLVQAASRLPNMVQSTKFG